MSNNETKYVEYFFNIFPLVEYFEFIVIEMAVKYIWKINKIIHVLYLGYGETGEVPVYGTHSILPKEHGAKSFALPIVRHLTREVGAIATWDSSIHESLCLNTVTSGM